jgi:tetratricopeptide (TPR) repeat protein
LPNALEAYRAGQLDVALERFGEALRAPGNGPAELAQIHLHLGILRTSLGDLPAARRAFEVALALDPDLEAPRELAPASRAAFEEVRAASAGERLVVEVRATGEASRSRQTPLSVAAARAPAGLVARIDIEAGPEGGPVSWTTSVSGPGPAAVELPPAAWADAASLRLNAAARDEHGGLLASASTVLAAPARAPVVTAQIVPRPRRTARREGNLLTSAWFWTGVGAVVTGVVVTGMVLAASEERYEVGAPTVR